jgi:hypothetical protein
MIFGGTCVIVTNGLTTEGCIFRVGWTSDYHCVGTRNVSYLSQSTLATMSTDTKDSPTGNDLLKNSSLYREFQAEREEILKHKWIESEKAGKDIGFERALTDWIVKHRSKWRRNRHTAVRADN